MPTLCSPFGAAEIVPGLWQGGWPYIGQPGEAGVRADTVVLCAKEVQPTGAQLPGVERIHVPLDDAAISNSDYGRAIVAAEKVVERLVAGKTVLVTCHMGINRSGLVTGLSLILGYGMSGDEAVALIRRRRKLPRGYALGNEHFAKFLRSYGNHRLGRNGHRPAPPAPYRPNFSFGGGA